MRKSQNPNVTIMLASACNVVARLVEGQSVRKVALDFHVSHMTLSYYLDEMMSIYNENHPKSPVTRADVVRPRGHRNETEKSVVDVQDDAKAEVNEAEVTEENSEETRVRFTDMESINKAMDEALAEAKRIERTTERLEEECKQLLKKLDGILKKYNDGNQEEK